MSSQQYKDKLQQFYLENAEIKNATMEGENTSIRIAQHYRTLLELLRLLGIQEILEAGDTSTTGTVAKLLGGVSIADVFKVSSDIGLTDPEDPPQQVLTRLANGDIKLKPIEEFVSENYIEIKDQFNDVNGDLDLDLITQEGLYYSVKTRDQDLNGIEGLTLLEPHLINVEVKINEPINTIIQKVTYFGYASDSPNIVYRINSASYGGWTDWRYMVEDYNGVTPTVTASVITNYSINPQSKTEHWNLTMTGDTDFDFANMFASGNSKVITITLEGDYAFTFPSWLKSLETNDDYDTIGGTLVAEIVINIKNGGATPQGYYSLQMIDYAL